MTAGQLATQAIPDELEDDEQASDDETEDDRESEYVPILLYMYFFSSTLTNLTSILQEKGV